MPAVSLVVCVHRQRDLLERLMEKSKDCYDDLVVLHDIPDSAGIRPVVEAAGGRFFERPPSFLQEPHWPFAWEHAAHDWILRLDADEFPSDELAAWLREFRRLPEPDRSLSGFSCIWPLWNGHKPVTQHWPAGRFFLFHRQRVRFFGMCEQSPIPDGKCEALGLVLHHQPPGRKTYGLQNMLLRPQSRRGREFIARCLLGKPTDLVCWRWESEQWPPVWEQIRQTPWKAIFQWLFLEPLRTLRRQWRAERRVFITDAIGGGVYRSLTCLAYVRAARRRVQIQKAAKTHAN